MKKEEDKMEENMVLKKNVMDLKVMEHPYLHELFKCVLQYDAKEVKNRLGKEFGGKLLRRWYLDRTFNEIISSVNKRKIEKRTLIDFWFSEPVVKADVVWRLKDEEGLGYRFLLHEIKTGKYNLNNVVWEYRQCNFKLQGCRFGRIKVQCPLFLWCWPKYYHINTQSDEIKNLIRRGVVRICDLNWILDILYRRLEEVFGFDGRNKRRGL